MATILKNGAVFLHIPKTGGNWVTKILKELELVKGHVGHKHTDVDNFIAPHITGSKALLKYTAHRLLNPISSKHKPYMFCFVRNPLTWYESWFSYMEMPVRRWSLWGNKDDIYNWHPSSVLNGLGNCSFADFVRNVNTKRPGYVTELYGWYTKYNIDFIGKQESLADDLIKVLKIMKVDFDEDFIRCYERLNISQELKLIWPDELKLETALFEYSGIMRYGYQSVLKEIEIEKDNLTRLFT